jgi:hypothetical protein
VATAGHDEPGDRYAMTRTRGGRFGEGNPGGPGDAPALAKSHQLRAALLSAVTPEDIREVAAKLLESAKGGSLPAIRELLNRCIGKPREVKDTGDASPTLSLQLAVFGATPAAPSDALPEITLDQLEGAEHATDSGTTKTTA